jgi:hypothetical protein
MDKCLPKNDDVRKLTRWIGSLDPHQIPLNNVNPKLISKSAFPLELVQGKWVALYSRALLRDAAVGAVDAHQAIVHAATLFSVLENNLEQIG